MITILLVDDEKLFLDDLISSFNWSPEGFEVVGTAPNGKRALELFRKLSPQVVIADIQMPHMDGLTLAEEIKKLDEFTVVVLLTSFQDFGYAHKALRSNVSDYILKGEIGTVALTEKLRSIHQLAEKNEERRRAIKEATALELLLREGDGVINHPVQIDFLQDKYVYLFVETDDPHSRYGLSSERKKPTFRLRHSFPDTATCLSFQMYLSLPEATVVVFTTHSHSLYEIETALRREAEEVLRETKARNLHVTLFLYATPSTLQEIVGKYSALHLKFMKRFLFGTRKIYSADEFQENVVPSEEAEDAYGFLRTFTQLNLEEAEEQLNKKIDNIILENDYIQAVIATQTISRALFHLAFESRTEIEDALWYDMDDFRSWAVSTLHFVKTRPFGTGKKKLSTKILGAVDYITMHYADNALTIEVVSDYLQLSAGRLSNKFKLEMGITVNQFITQVRIQHAKALLRKEDSLIYQVATQVGYGSPQYFSQIFQNLTGMTPTEYKNKHSAVETSL